MILDDSAPRYLPHSVRAGLLAMLLSPLASDRRVKVDASLARFHRPKHTLAAERHDDVYRWLPGLVPAQRKLAEQLLADPRYPRSDVFAHRPLFLPPAAERYRPYRVAYWKGFDRLHAALVRYRLS